MFRITGDNNLTISAPVVAYKWKLNHVLPESFPNRGKLYKRLVEISLLEPYSQKFMLRAEDQERLFKSSRRSNQRVSEHYLGGLPICRQSQAERSAQENFQLDAEDFDHISALIVEKLPQFAELDLESVRNLEVPQ